MLNLCSDFRERKFSFTKNLLVSTCLCVAVSGGMASAQEADVVAEPKAEQDVARLKTITVTAQKREQDAQDVPISLIALDEDMLEASQVTGTEDLRSAVPALNITTAVGGFGLPRIRGIGSTGQGVGIENPVAVYVDGVYYSSSFGVLQNAFDAEQITVLKGPQGTLFGRNATGGLIQLSTMGPSRDFRFKAEAGAANFDTVTGAAFVSGPISKTVSGSLSGQYLHRAEGYGQNVYTGGKVGDELSYNLRGKLLFEFADSTTVLIAADASERSAGTPAFRPQDINDAGENVADLISAAGGDPDYDIYADLDPQVEAQQMGVGVTLDHSFGDIAFKSITAYRESELLSVFDPDGRIEPRIQIFTTDKSETFSQEFNLLSDNDSKLQWVVGLYYINDNSYEPNSRSRFQFGPPASAFWATTRPEQKLSSVAAFAEVTYALTPATNLILGGRYTRDERDFSISGTSGSPFAPPTSQFGPVSKTFEEPTWRASIDHRFNDNFMAYFSYNRGFRSGSFVPRNPPVELDPEIVDAFELGLKSDFWDGRARVNAAAYYYDQSSVQIFQIIAGEQYIDSATDGADIKGVDADFSFDITDGLTLFGGLSWIDATYNNLPNARLTLPFPLDASELALANGQACEGTFAPPSTYTFLPGGNCIVFGDASGNRLQNTPELTYTLGGRYEVQTSAGTFELSGNYYYNDGYFVGADNRLFMPSFNTLAASATWRAPSDRFYVSAWGRNLTDGYYLSQYGASNSGDNGYAGAPRTYGMTVGFDF